MSFLKAIFRRRNAALASLIAEADQARDNADWPAARRLYRTILDRAPNRAGTWAQFGHALREAGAFVEAETAYKTAIRQAPQRADLRVQLGHFLVLTDRPAEAVEAYMSALECDPRCEPARDALHSLRRQGQSLDAGRAAAALSARSLEAGAIDRFWLDGALEDTGGRVLTGWALDTRPDAAPLTVEIWIDGVFQGLVLANGFRRDLQDRFGGSGLAGFSFRPPDPGPAEGGQIEIREAVSHQIIARAVQDEAKPRVEAWRAARRELADPMRRTPELEARLADIERDLAFDLEDYGRYFETFYREPASVEAAPPADVGAGVVLLDIGGQTSRMIEDAIHSLAGQDANGWSLIIHGVAPDQPDLIARLCPELEGRCGRAPVIVPAGSAMDEILAEATEAWLITVPADGVLAPDALSRFAKAFSSPDVMAVYGDEDSLEPTADFRTSRRSAPLLRPGFDPDLLAQTPYVGGCVAFRMDVIRDVGLRDIGELRAADALLRWTPPPEGVIHLDRILYSRRPGHRPQPRDIADWANCVTAALAGQAGLAVLPHDDVLGAAASAVRIRRLAPEDTTACLIIPTRDKPELLKACVEGILALRDAWTIRTEIIVIDHDTRDVEAKAYLTEIARHPGVRITGFSGPFNWALMNNLAAEMTTADVLVFLNNDTLPLSPDWLDELAVQALRPEVGVVGARLIYGDRSIQHAGIVARDRPDAFLVHEGVGAPGDDPGYMGRHALMRSVVAVTGAAMATRREVFESLGGFDAEHFPVEGNDVDFCMRAAASGLRVLYAPGATLFHLESKSRGFSHSGAKQAVAVAATDVLWRRWGERFGRDPGLNRHFGTRSRPFTRLVAPP